MIHAAYRLWGGDGFFAKMTGTSMLSMFENTKEKVTVHIMHNDRLTPDNRGKLCYIAGQYNQQVEFHNVEEIAGSTLRKFEAAYPIASGINAAWYPLIIHEVFPNLDKIIFLGADTVINLDIAELWAYDLMGGGYGFAAVPDHLLVPKKVVEKVTGINPLVIDNLVKYEDYFCADVFLMNPEFFRENFEIILDGCRFIYNSKRYDQNEQDVLNYLFSTKYKKLPFKFNTAAIWTRQRFYLKSSSPHIEKVIYHFGGPKPDLNVDDVLYRLYWKYFLKTPWATVDMFGNLNKAMEKTFGQFFNDSRNMLLHVTNLLSERRRAFFIDENFLEGAKKFFEIKDNELIMDLSTSPEMLIQKLNEAKGEIILFVLTKNYRRVGNFLLNQKFIEGTDFINGFLFLSERHGINFYFEIKSIVQAISKDV